MYDFYKTLLYLTWQNVQKELNTFVKRAELQTSRWKNV